MIENNAIAAETTANDSHTGQLLAESREAVAQAELLLQSIKEKQSAPSPLANVNMASVIANLARASAAIGTVVNRKPEDTAYADERAARSIINQMAIGEPTKRNPAGILWEGVKSKATRATLNRLLDASRSAETGLIDWNAFADRILSIPLATRYISRQMQQLSNQMQEWDSNNPASASLTPSLRPTIGWNQDKMTVTWEISTLIREVESQWEAITLLAEGGTHDAATRTFSVTLPESRMDEALQPLATMVGELHHLIFSQLPGFEKPSIPSLSASTLLNLPYLKQIITIEKQEGDNVRLSLDFNRIEQSAMEDTITRFQRYLPPETGVETTINADGALTVAITPQAALKASAHHLGNMQQFMVLPPEAQIAQLTGALYTVAGNIREHSTASGTTPDQLADLITRLANQIEQHAAAIQSSDTPLTAEAGLGANLARLLDGPLDEEMKTLVEEIIKQTGHALERDYFNQGSDRVIAVLASTILPLISMDAPNHDGKISHSTVTLPYEMITALHAMTSNPSMLTGLLPGMEAKHAPDREAADKSTAIVADTMLGLASSQLGAGLGALGMLPALAKSVHQSLGKILGQPE
jgi:hypothetical protein